MTSSSVSSLISSLYSYNSSIYAANDIPLPFDECDSDDDRLISNLDGFRFSF